MLRDGGTTRAVLERFPKTRPELPAAIRAIKSREHLLNRRGGDPAAAASRRLEAWMHREVAGSASAGCSTLELGAGRLNHVPYEVEKGRPLAYDIVEPGRELFEEAPGRDAVRAAYSELGEVPESARYDRIVSIAVLEHLTDLPDVVARCGQRLEPGGVFHHGIPSEGGLLWGLAWRTTTGLLYRLRTGYSRRFLMRHEHVNDAAEVIAVVRWFFRDVEVRRFPALGLHLSFYTALRATQPDLGRCREWLESPEAQAPPVPRR